MKKYQTIVIVLCALFVFGCSRMQPVETKSPTEVLKTLNEASKNKDVASIKNSVSKGTLALIEESAKAQNTTVDELLKKDNGAPFKDLPEMRNEKIEGDTATIELKNTNSEDWEPVPFIKEDGVWKLALDKYLEDFKRKANEDMKMPSNSNQTNPDDSPLNVGGNNKAAAKPKEAANKPAKNKK